jgi:hypothetical protein
MDLLFADTGTTITLTTTLNETLTSIDTTITLTDASDFPVKGTITISDETIIYTGKSSNNLTGCVRGSSDTTAISHSSGSTVTAIARTSQSGLGNDKGKAGWYVDRFHNDKTLRLSDSDIILPGIVRFNKNNDTFQGFDGTVWVDFNAVKGDTGDAGTNGLNTFDVVNLPTSTTVDGEIYSSTSGNDLQLRSLTSATFDANSTLTDVSSINITKSDDYLTLEAAPRPYIWDFSSNNTVTYLKSSLSSSTLKAFGSISTWKVKSGQSITAGTAVRITLSVSGTGYSDSVAEIVIEPYIYTALQEEINEGSGVLGIALQSKSSGSSCQVCTEGVTTVMMGSGDGAGNQTSTTVDGPGAHGFVGYDAKVYNESLSTGISTNTPIIGHWMERGNFSTGTAVLFYVRTGFSMT